MFKSLTSPQFGQLGTRFVAFVLDVFFVSVAYGVAVCLITGNFSQLFSRFGVSTGNVTVDLIIGCSLFTVYFSLMQGIWHGQTLGMKLIGIKLVNAEDERVTILQAVIRNVIFLLSTFLTLGITVVINYVLLVFTPKQYTIHDILSKTYIVSVKR